MELIEFIFSSWLRFCGTIILLVILQLPVLYFVEALKIKYLKNK